ncbi:hypothetical protein GSI_02875 [Ganoderma sinense ZZ0214-1]|uniref:Uncharacterized protein n=1 Tax=Ganoderma sinense ZZ0214-1 TaxID=1077348 RepID=A0A2G8SMT4_9APHY|nr:hypothetical protein GSI_02875 [Ganoderma sinense ZZ0214-1]
MSNNANTTSQTASQPAPKKQDSPTQADAQSVLSENSTLCSDSAVAKKDQSSEAKKTVKLSDSSVAFAKKAKEEGWGAPTATRPSLGA